MAIFEVFAPGFSHHRTDVKDFLYGVYWDQDQQLKHPENTEKSI
jgi:hypothetical protein